MEDVLFKAVAQYVFGVLFVALLFYVLKANEKREERLVEHNRIMQSALQEMMQTLKLMQAEIRESISSLKEDISDIKDIIMRR